MQPWIMGGALAVALLAGFGVGWLVGRTSHLRIPNVWVSALVLLAGSLGGPLLTHRLLGVTLPSSALALLIAGASAGIVFWPMGQRQGEREWL